MIAFYRRVPSQKRPAQWRRQEFVIEGFRALKENFIFRNDTFPSHFYPQNFLFIRQNFFFYVIDPNFRKILHDFSTSSSTNVSTTLLLLLLFIYFSLSYSSLIYSS